MNTQKQIILIIALTFIFVGGCAAYTAIELPVRAPDQADWTRDQSLERGALLFANNCRTCHGNKGQGGVGPQLLNAELTQFQDQDPLILRANRQFITRTLQCGRAGTLMPAWLNTNGGSLNAIQIQHLVNFLTYKIDVDEETQEVESKWWDEAEEFAHNLNAEVSVLVGGDTLGTIAKAHGIGPKELAAYNNMPLEGRIKKGTEIRIPPFADDQNGYVYTVYKDNETFTKIAESQFVGAVIIADLNGLQYEFSEKRGVATMHLTRDGADIAGLFPNEFLQLPDGATYLISAGDTLESVAAKHSISVNQLVSLNDDLLGDLEDDAEIPFERRLELPRAIYIVQAGDTLEGIAELHGIPEDEVADLQELNNLEDDAELVAGSEFRLPNGTQYVVQAGDTLAIVAQTHATTAGDLAAANDLQASDTITPDVVIAIPKIERYDIQGQDLAAVAGSYGNVTAESLAEANGVDANQVLAIGQTLELPEDAFGGRAPDAINTGAACLPGIVTQNVIDGILGVAIVKPEPPPSSDVLFEAGANDWTLTADGVESDPNRGGVLVAPGTQVRFASVSGLHNITINTETQGADINTGDTRTLTFDTAGEFELTCTYHPQMKGVIFVE